MFFKTVYTLFLTFLLSGCNTVVMNASGYVAREEAKLIVIATCLMLIIIIPVIFLTLFFAWKYRQSNTKSTYTPEWSHSTTLEIIIWGLPLLIIIILGYVTWISTHLLDPARPLDKISQNQLVKNIKPIEVEVVALDWKWLFIYPELGIATVNTLVIPIDTPIHFKITSSTVMNSFFIPALAGQIYAMPGMRTQLNAVMNKIGEFDGLSSNYSGAGFSDMHFKVSSMTAKNFNKWIIDIKTKNTILDNQIYMNLEKPSKKVSPQYYGKVEENLFNKVVNMCVQCKEHKMENMHE